MLKSYYRPQLSCGKVMFSQECVKNSVPWGMPQCIWDIHPLANTPGQTPPGRPPKQTPQVVTAADRMHPTGMHSCSYHGLFNVQSDTGRERLIRSHSSARFCFELSGNLN